MPFTSTSALLPLLATTPAPPCHSPGVHLAAVDITSTSQLCRRLSGLMDGAVMTHNLSIGPGHRRNVRQQGSLAQYGTARVHLKTCFTLRLLGFSPEHAEYHLAPTTAIPLNSIATPCTPKFSTFGAPRPSSSWPLSTAPHFDSVPFLALNTSRGVAIRDRTRPFLVADMRHSHTDPRIRADYYVQQYVEPHSFIRHCFARGVVSQFTALTDGALDSEFGAFRNTASCYLVQPSLTAKFGHSHADTWSLNYYVQQYRSSLLATAAVTSAGRVPRIDAATFSGLLLLCSQSTFAPYMKRWRVRASLSPQALFSFSSVSVWAVILVMARTSTLLVVLSSGPAPPRSTRQWMSFHSLWCMLRYGYMRDELSSGRRLSVVCAYNALDEPYRRLVVYSVFAFSRRVRYEAVRLTWVRGRRRRVPTRSLASFYTSQRVSLRDVLAIGSHPVSTGSPYAFLSHCGDILCLFGREFHSDQSDFGSMFSSISRVIRLDQLIYIPYRSIRHYNAILVDYPERLCL
ncbi:hypothetical protein EXIGLDRAFT_795041 [Exidia glandulosa HHB12029]|uniref:Uncharacterized protein n=1 Tax=Exidia glandulosa HHB12029 TaxID=1314781 RepID=A0A165G532_EXIGL|nr:hypothetical protein EXIGLDRAFT_795041 [Exidia glandulosa HHB12029]